MQHCYHRPMIWSDRGCPLPHFVLILLTDGLGVYMYLMLCEDRLSVSMYFFYSIMLTLSLLL